ncbi:hypothetical protein [Brevundimonas sp.]|uniref:hypothetical protein n=1 Tax=Brevundimonas sp. TaxID=1871086 RepID=UPI0035AE72CA
MTTELTDRDGEVVRKGRISPALRTAITLIIHEGLTVREAAIRAGYQYESLQKALLKPHVRAFRADVKRAWLDSQTERAWIVAAQLQMQSASDDVRLKAAKVFIEADKEASSKMPAEVRQTVQIVTNNVNMGVQPTHNQLSGVIEAEPFHPLPPRTSDCLPVRRAESEDDEDE